MSRILRRPMFRGGPVSSYGTGIASGLGDNRVGMFEGGISTAMMEELTGGSNVSRTRGSNILSQAMNKIRNVPYLRAVVPAAGGIASTAAGQFILPALGGYGIGKAADFITRATDTPEAYQFRKDALRDNPFLFDETSTDEFEEFSEKLTELDQGEKPGLYPGGYDKFLKDKGYVKEPGTDRIVKKEELEKPEPKEEPGPKGPPPPKKKPEVEESLNVGEDLEETKKLFEGLLGKDKARKRDLEAMGFSLAGKALRPGADLKSTFADFFEEEAKRPSEVGKISTAAANAVINKYIKGEISKAELQKILATEKFRTDYRIQAAKAGLSFDDKLENAADKQKKSKKSLSVIQSAIEDTAGLGEFKGVLPKDVNQLEIGAIYVGDSEDKSYKILYQVDSNKNPKPIKNIF
jgi:hypothetical protein